MNLRESRNENLSRQVREVELPDQSIQTGKPIVASYFVNFLLGYKSNPEHCLDDLFVSIANDIQQHEIDTKERRYQRKGQQREDFIRHVRAYILSAYRAHRQNTDNLKILSVVRNKNQYAKNKYDRLYPHATYKHAKAAYEGLCSLGYVQEIAKGFYEKNSKNASKNTEAQITEKLIHRLEDVVAGRDFSFCMNGDEIAHANFIELKDNNKKKINFDGNQNSVKEMQSNLRSINSFLRDADISIPDHIIACNNIKLEDVLLYRIFNNSDFGQGGRFYKGWWEHIRSEHRPYITINGNKAIELDYSALHPTILYAREGIEFQPTCYEPMEGIDRDVGKRALNALLNASTSYINSVEEYDEFVFNNEDNVDVYIPEWDEFLAKLIEHNKPIAHYFGTGEGMKLQYEDSCIVEEILLILNTKGIVALPIHDSFIVEEQYKDTLKELMEEFFYNKFRVIPTIK
jgi:hypothetical protein